MLTNETLKDLPNMRAQPALAAPASPHPPMPQRDTPKGPMGINCADNFTGPLSAPRRKRGLATPKSCGIFWKKSRGIVESKSTSMGASHVITAAGYAPQIGGIHA